MGVDIALGLIILIWAVRGYLRGFVLQAIHLAGLVACVYLANPIRDFARPHLQPQFPSIQPELLDRLIWWTAAVGSLVLMTGLAAWIFKASRRRPLGEPEPDYADKGAGFVLGATKGLVVAAALAYLFDTYALGHLKNLPWLDKQARDSRSLAWSREYRPAVRLWESQPVQLFVTHVRSNGLTSPAPRSVVEAGASAILEAAQPTQNPQTRQAQAPTAPPLRAAPPPSLKLQAPPQPRSPRPGSPEFLQEFDKALRDEGITPKSR
jgi:uncharacterized membrane protein required for colicin V production